MAGQIKDPRPLTQERIRLAQSFGYNVRIWRNIPLNNEVTNAVQTRTQHEFPEEVTKQYMESMAGGAQFPLPLITEDKGVVLGKTTVEAMRRRLTAGHMAHRYFDALVLTDVNYIGASKALLDDLLLMDAYSNQANGVRLTEPDLREAIGVAYARGHTADMMAAKLGVNVRTVNHEINRILGIQRITKVMGDGKNDPLAGLETPQIAHLGKLSKSLNDGPFKALIEITRDAGLRIVEMNEIVAKVKATRSDTAAAAVFKEARIELMSRIRKQRATGQRGTRTRTDWEMFQLPLDHISKFAGRETEVLHLEPIGNAEFAETVAVKLDVAIAVLEKVRANLR
jgi:hypothetical protein